MLRAQDRWPLDVPNQRSLHERPVPRSGGIAMMAGVFSGFAILQTPLVIVLPAAVLVALSHLDDVHGLPIPVRLGAQFAAAAAFVLGALPTPGLPALVLIVIGILWVTNLYNFMDGSDGLAHCMPDSVLPSLKPIGDGDRFWEAHKQHYYQRLVRMGWGPRRTALAEYALMLACGTTALWALREPLPLQLCALIGLVALHATLALWVDHAYRRREGKSIESA